MQERPHGRDSGRRPARRVSGERRMAALPGRRGGIMERQWRRPVAAAHRCAGPDRHRILRRPPGQHRRASPHPRPARLVTPAAPSATSALLTSLTSPTDDVYSTVRSVQPDNSGGVAISLDETRRNVVKGSMSDGNIQRLLLAAAHEDNPAVRVESVDLLRSQSGSSEVRDALLNVLSQDTNAGVRLKALEGLKLLAADSEVRKTLRNVLLTDDNVAVRMLAIDLLVANRDDNMVGMMQGLVQKENNNSVRLKMEKALRDMNASPGRF